MDEADATSVLRTSVLIAFLSVVTLLQRTGTAYEWEPSNVFLCNARANAYLSSLVHYRDILPAFHSCVHCYKVAVLMVRV